MPFRLYIISAIFISIHLPCSGGFDGFPLAAGTNFNWYSINAEYAPIAQIYSGIVERCGVVDVALPQWTQTLYIDSSATGTVSTMIVTNAIAPVAYTNSYTNGLAYPTVTHSMLSEFDETIDELIPKFASTNIYLYPSLDYGAYTKAGLFSEIGVGLVYTNVVTVGTNYVTNIVARWTRSPERRWTETLVEMHSITSGWRVISAQPVEWWYGSSPSGAVQSTSIITSTPLPRLIYGPTTTTWSVSLSGIDLFGSNRTETVTSGEECTVNWQSITGTPVVSGFDTTITGAWFSVQYTNDVVVYGDRPYQLYATDLDERVAVLKVLNRTAMDAVSSTTSTNYRGKYFGQDSVREDLYDWGTAKSNAIADWAGSSGNSPYVSPQFYSSLEKFKDVRTYLSARLEQNYYRPNLEAVATNRPAVITFMVYFSPEIVGGLSTTNVVYSDFGTGYVTGQWSVVAADIPNTSTNINSPTYVPWEPGTIPPSPWPDYEPALDETYVKSIGRIPSWGLKALLHWEFDYK